MKTVTGSCNTKTWSKANKFVYHGCYRGNSGLSWFVLSQVRDRTVRCVVKQIDRALVVSAWRSSGSCVSCMKKAHRYLCIIGCSRGLGNYLTTLYIFCKVLYIGESLMIRVRISCRLVDAYRMYILRLSVILYPPLHTESNATRFFHNRIASRWSWYNLHPNLQYCCTLKCWFARY